MSLITSTSTSHNTPEIRIGNFGHFHSNSMDNSSQNMASGEKGMNHVPPHSERHQQLISRQLVKRSFASSSRTATVEAPLDAAISNLARKYPDIDPVTVKTSNVVRDSDGRLQRATIRLNSGGYWGYWWTIDCQTVGQELKSTVTAQKSFRRFGSHRGGSMPWQHNAHHNDLGNLTKAFIIRFITEIAVDKGIYRP